MSRVPILFLGLAILTVPLSKPASAGPLKLTITGTAFGASVNYTADVSNGFSGATIGLTNSPISVLFPNNPNPAPGVNVPINSTFDLLANLSGVNGNAGQGAIVNLSGLVQGGYGHVGRNPDLSGGISGMGQATGLFLKPGTSAGDVPSWFTGLSAQVFGSITGGTLNLLASNLSIIPGPSPQVPEPTPLFAFLATGLLLGLKHRLRRLTT